MKRIPICKVCKAHLYPENKRPESKTYGCRYCGRQVVIAEERLEIREEKEF